MFERLFGSSLVMFREAVLAAVIATLEVLLQIPHIAAIFDHPDPASFPIDSIHLVELFRSVVGDVASAEPF